MNKVVYVIVIICLCQISYGQANHSPKEKKVCYGINIGTNFSMVFDKPPLQEDILKHSGIGIQIGILSKINLTESISILPKIDLAMHDLGVQSIEKPLNTYQINPITINIGSHFQLDLMNSKVYVLMGPTFRLASVFKSEDTSVFPVRNDIAIDVGIGLSKYFNKFIIAPELRYSYGLLDVSNHPSYKNLRVQTITLLCNFLG